MGFARSDYGQNIAELYEKANVTGPSEFGALPAKDRRYWNSWFSERIRRINDDDSDVQSIHGGM